MPSETIEFKNNAGLSLSARLDLPAGDPVATALLAHCFTCTKDLPAARRIAARLSAMGFAVMRFDFTGLGQSEGRFAQTDFTSNVDDLVAASAYLTDRNLTPSLLIGHSLGGAAVLKAAAQLPQIKGVVTVGAPFDPAHVTHHFASAIPDIIEKGSAEVTLGGRPFTIGKQFVEDVQGIEIETAVRNLNAALLVMHSPVNETVGIENASQIFGAARHPKSFVTLDKADHLLRSPEDAEYAAGVIAAWAERYIDVTRPAPPIGVPEGVTRVSEADPKGFLQDIRSGEKHHVLADEPQAYGGTNQGMSPYGFLAAGLGACTSMTIRMYARRKGWPLEHVSVDVTHDKMHAQDSDPATNVRIDNFRRAIHLSGPLTPQQTTRLMEIADKCPVHKTLEQSSRIETVLASGG